MSTNMSFSSSRMDSIKLITAIVVLIAGIIGFYYFSDERLLRVIGLMVAIGIAVLLALQTVQGQMVRSFFSSAQLEVRKVVWPTRQETIHTSLIVIVVVILVALMLWGLDSLFGWLTRSLLN